MEARNQCDSEPDHYAAHDKRPQDPPNQNAMLRARWHAEIGKDQNKDENVIDAQRVLDEVTGEKFQPFLRSTQFPHEQIEKQRKHDPDQAAPRGRAHAQLALAPLKADKINSQRDEDTDVKGDPKPNAGCHSALPFHGRRFTAIANALQSEFSLAKQILHRSLCDSHGAGAGETC